MYKRGKIWYFRINGVAESSETSDKERAKRLCKQREDEAFDRKHGFYIKVWEEACEDWLALNEHLDSHSTNLRHAAWWLPHLQGRKLNTITKELIHEIIVKNRPVDLKAKSKKNATANIYVKFPAKVLRAEKLKPDFTVYAGIGRSKRWLRPEEWQVLASHMDDDIRDMATFALATGLREMNVAKFEWSWLHSGDTVAYLPKEVTKTDEDYGIPLNKSAQMVIQRRRQAKVCHHKYVFTEQGEEWKFSVCILAALHKAVDAAGIEHMTFHTLRHTFASWIAQRGVSDAVRKRLGCWSAGEGASGGYLHFDVESLRPFAEMLDPILTQEERHEQVREQR